MKKTSLFAIGCGLYLLSAAFLIAQNDTTFYGQGAGQNGDRNSNFGYFAGSFQGTPGNDNTYIGSRVARSAFGDFNVSAGAYSAYYLQSGSRNSFLGATAGFRNISGSDNLFAGFAAGYANKQSQNVMIGDGAGANNDGARNVFIGYSAGANETGSDKLYIDNSSTSKPLIYGNFATKKIGINTNNLIDQIGTIDLSAYSLYVKGGILTEEIHVQPSWADYVFEKDYELMPLTQVASFIEKNGHLPNIPSTEVVAIEGIELGDMTKRQQEKIEELMLYVIEIQKEIDTINKELETNK
ncbi:hypothetical protein KORDIASMS9_01721 [Kordia sp. SMS9]|uniref:hypothetical protein n=1 Tax=Kordia sp. SMS9 TaxID=2282170 RepID=UPI000E0CF241|nr:hypothetical protein [Kordia sp. SMS9]AXG69498.1 hypothetical protein KORDIASMS9_01721 [Kordia sp. SMS9]